jgi:hypothetical protein
MRRPTWQGAVRIDAVAQQSGSLQWRRLAGCGRDDAQTAIALDAAALTRLDASRNNVGDFCGREYCQMMVAKGGIEPPTRGFSIRCSTN